MQATADRRGNGLDESQQGIVGERRLHQDRGHYAQGPVFPLNATPSFSALPFLPRSSLVRQHGSSTCSGALIEFSTDSVAVIFYGPRQAGSAGGPCI